MVRGAAQERCSLIRVPAAQSQGELLSKIMFLLNDNSLNTFLIPEEKSLLTDLGLQILILASFGNPEVPSKCMLIIHEHSALLH